MPAAARFSRAASSAAASMSVPRSELVRPEPCALDELGAGAHEGIPHDVVGAGRDEAHERGSDGRVRRCGDRGLAVGEALVGEAAWHELERDAAGLIVDDELPRALGRVVHELLGRGAHELGAAPGECATVATVRPCEAKADRGGGAAVVRGARVAVGTSEGAQDGERARVGDRADDGLCELSSNGHRIEREAEVESGAYRGGSCEGPFEASVDEAGAGDSRPPCVAELAAEDLFEPSACVEADGEWALGGAADVDGARALASGGALDHQRGTRCRLRDTLGADACESVACRLGADLAEGLRDGAAIVVASGGVPCLEERTLDDLLLRCLRRLQLAERSGGRVPRLGIGVAEGADEPAACLGDGPFPVRLQGRDRRGERAVRARGASRRPGARRSA